jgi:hypothetical protein
MCWWSIGVVTKVDVCKTLKIPFWRCGVINSIYGYFMFPPKEQHIHKVYAAEIAKIDIKLRSYFIRSAGLNAFWHQKILLILKKLLLISTISFVLYRWSSSHQRIQKPLRKYDESSAQSKSCMSSAILMAKDMQFYMVQGKVLQFNASICRKMYLIYRRKILQ